MYSYWILYICIFLAAGLASGFFSSLFEIGGIIRVPIFFLIFVLLGVDYSIAPFMAVGTSLAVSIPSSVVSLRVQYREWTLDGDRDQITDFLMRWMPFLALGIAGGVISARYSNGWFLVGAFSAALLFLAIQVFVLRSSYILYERFPNRMLERFIALITGAASVLAGIPGALAGAVVKAFSCPWESAYVAAASAVLVSFIGTAGFIINGPGFSEAAPFAAGYVDPAAALSTLAGIYLASRVGRWLDLSHRLQTFKKYVASDRLTESFTGLYNRKYFDAMLVYSIAHSNMFSEPVSLLLIDVDNLTIHNKKHGQKAANIVLTTLASMLSESVRAIDIPARYGGDEFIVILPRTDKNKSIAIARRIKDKFKNMQIKFDSGIKTLSLSVGISTYPETAPDMDLLMVQSEKAMRASKNNGKDTITHYEDITTGWIEPSGK